MPQPDDITSLRVRRDAALASTIAESDRALALDAAIARAQRADDGAGAARLAAERAAAQRAADAARAEHGRLRDQAFSIFVDWVGQTPEQIVATLSDAHPCVLLPVRIETKFARVGAGSELRVRLYPDDIGIASPPAPVTDNERTLGEAYWRARAAARHAPGDDELRRAYEGAWATLAAAAGAYRAGYIVRVTAPSDPDAAPDALTFSAPPPAAVPPVARSVLPDRFVIIAATLDPTTGVPHEIARATGAPIPDDLVLAPEPSQPDSAITRDAAGRLVVPDALKWMVDFETAVQVGMAVRLPLTPPFDTAGFDRLVAIGIRSATPAAQAPAAIEALFANHRDTRGMGLLRAGTPTNNSDSAVSGWPPDETQELFNIEDAPPDLTPGAGPLGVSDGWRLGDLFGLGPNLTRRLPGATATDIAEAMTMNRALVPGTIDDFVGEFLKGVVGPAVAQDLHRFFTDWVSGRGHFPPLRVARQPYGIVLAGAWRNWTFPPPTGRQPDIAPALYPFMAPHRLRWQMLARHAPHAGETGGDGFERLLAILGQLASSSEFVSRKAVSDEYIIERLRFAGTNQAAIQGWFNVLRPTRNSSLGAINFPAVSGPTDPLLAFIVFLRETQAWRLPLVDRDPAVPLSETSPVGPFDGAHNYLWWLTQASREDLSQERLLGADGNPAPAPTALLYVLLRHGLLAALEAGTLDAASQFGSASFEVIERDPLIANVGGEQHILRRDYLNVDAARLGLTSTPTALADWALTSAQQPAGQRPASTERIAEARDAIAALVDIPTARLERLMAEHVDLASYRLDAWISALYRQRLDLIRTRSETRGLHLGAYGFVENLRPAARERVPPESLPAGLRDGAGPNIFVDEANGGFIHAPSLMQATTAAVLRNGYLSHADPQAPQRFAVNLSSARIRAALALAQGVREGQPLGALLGYQLERGLHEGHPGIELDAAIGTLRDQFPLLSGRLTDLPPGVSAEVIEARNVVDGLALVEATQGQAYPYGLAGLPAGGTPQGDAIAAEVDRLHDALDALSDVLLAESVHQAVQGNLTRTKASLDALTSPEAPPEPEIVRTPRSGRVLAFRAALALDADAKAGWTPALSPRARANPQVNHWLAQHLPPAAAIQWTVTDGGGAPEVQSFAGLDLEPIDIVLMSGDRLGDQSSELERFLIGQYRIAHAVPDDRVTLVAPATAPFDPATTLLFDFAAGATSLAALQPALSHLRHIITRSRPAHAADWRRAADDADAADPTGSASGDPKLVNFKDLTDRLDAASGALGDARDALKLALASLAPLQSALDADPGTIGDPAWPPALAELRRRLIALTSFGMPEAMPIAGLTVTRPLVDALAGQAQSVIAIATDRLARAASLRATSFPDPLPSDEPARSRETARRTDVLRRSYGEAASALFGPALVITPLFRLAAAQAAEINAARTTPAVGDGLVVEEWLQSVARVRSRVADLAWALATTRWCGQPMPDPKIVQLPHKAGTPFIGGVFGTALPPGEFLAMLALDDAALAAPLQAGLLIDEWTETVPTDRETTGVAFNVNRPNATAPQAVLVAVPATLGGHWTFDDLVGAVHEALDLAQLRAVEPDALIGRGADQSAGAYFQALPAILTQFTAGRLAVVDFGGRVAAVVGS
jgi:hypothetical protein